MATPQKRQDGPQNEVPQEPTIIKILYVYVPVPKEYVDDPLLDYKQVMMSLGCKRQRAFEIMRLIGRYKDEKLVRVRKSRLEKWINDHTVDPSD